MNQRLRVTIQGAVQGVGFRPFLYRLAADLNLAGWVLNSCQGVFLEVEGPAERLETFLLRLQPEAPPRSSIQSLEYCLLEPAGFRGFEIRESDDSGSKTAIILPDIATCPDCLREVRDPANRRFRYPFTNCTNCGPRYSILLTLPYDRPHTTMRGFPMCPACREEYENPLDRRFHAQPNACPECGPQLALWSARGAVLETRDDALRAAAEALRAGAIVAVKGLGGFHLMVDARKQGAVRRLRRRKHREDKPLALIYPDLETVRRDCRVSALEERLLASPEAPIVLLPRRAESPCIAPAVAPHSPTLGIMLPSTPLHHILLSDTGFPVVATSGNLSDEPICTDEREALKRLGDIADLFLVHDRPIARHVDDSIVRVILNREQVLRRARGYAPLPVSVSESEGVRAPSVLALGAHQKNSVALSHGARVYVSQHVGDLETAESLRAFERVQQDLQKLYDMTPEVVACDMHPDYLSTRHAQRIHPAPVAIQHHHAHIVSCMAENELEGEALGVAWDGTGYGPDGTVWGGEFLLATRRGFERVASLRSFALPGGERAVREPRRAALGLLFEVFGEDVAVRTGLAPLRAFSAYERTVILAALHRRINAPRTSSAGRLFDAAASIIGLRQLARHEGQAAMELEYAAEAALRSTVQPYSIPLVQAQTGPALLDWTPMVREMLEDLCADVSANIIAARFHVSLAEAIVSVARAVGQERVALSGGCFQNRRLTELAVCGLREAGFTPFWHQRVPPNDGGIALGQAVAARAMAVSEAEPRREEMTHVSGCAG